MVRKRKVCTMLTGVPSVALPRLQYVPLVMWQILWHAFNLEPCYFQHIYKMHHTDIDLHFLPRSSKALVYQTTGHNRRLGARRQRIYQTGRFLSCIDCRRSESTPTTSSSASQPQSVLGRLTFSVSRKLVSSTG